MSRVKEWCKCRIRIPSVGQRTIIRALIRTMCPHHIGPHSHLNAFECTWARRQGESNLKDSHYIMQHVSAGRLQSREAVKGYNSHLIRQPRKRGGKEGTRSRMRMMSSLSFVSDSLFASQSSASGFRPAWALRGGLRARETRGWTKQAQYFQQSLQGKTRFLWLIPLCLWDSKHTFFDVCLLPK